MNAYEQKQADRRERMAERAEKLRAQANADFRKADLREEYSGIPMGQPILVGHHSEKRHRKALERADNAMRRAIETSNKAAELEARAASPSTAISSDDPSQLSTSRIVSASPWSPDSPVTDNFSTPSSFTKLAASLANTIAVLTASISALRSITIRVLCSVGITCRTSGNWPSINCDQRLRSFQDQDTR